MHNIDFNIFHELLMSKTYKHLGNIPLYGDDMFADMADVMDFVNSNKDKHSHNKMAMFEIHRYSRPIKMSNYDKRNCIRVKKI
jgi:hypothetical protein